MYQQTTLHLVLIVWFEGWSKEYNPVIVNPKIVTKVDEPVVDVALSVSRNTSCLTLLYTIEARIRPWYASGCLGPWFASGIVVPLGFRMSRTFLIPAPPPDFRSFQLPNTVFPRTFNRYTQTARFAAMRKISVCDDAFGALSTDGELFTFNPPESKATSGAEKVAIKPQLVWALRKKFTAVKVSSRVTLVVSVYILFIGLLNGR